MVSKIGLKEAVDFKKSLSLIKTFQKSFHSAIFREEERKNIRKATKKMQADNAEKLP